MVLKPGMCVFHVGCGVGGPACEIALFTDAVAMHELAIVGVNNNDFQIGRLRAIS
jgi:sterol 24-C-methyltransferase